MAEPPPTREAGPSQELMLADPGRSSALAQCAGQIIVQACGRNITMNQDEGASIMGMQAALQRELKMAGQVFSIADADGRELRTDLDVREALQHARLPLSAMLSDACIHFIENRREELAQMQWKLVRDQFVAATVKMTQLSRQVSELSQRLENQASEQKASCEEIRREVLASVEGTTIGARADLVQIAERVNSVNTLVASERTNREVAVQGVEKQLESVRDLLEADRQMRRQESSSAQLLLEETKRSIAAEASQRGLLEDRLKCDLNGLSDRLDLLSRGQAEASQDAGFELQKAAEEVRAATQAQERQVVKLRTELEATICDSAAHFVLLEERCATIEHDLSESVTRTGAALDRLSDRCDFTSKAMDTLQLQERRQEKEQESLLRRLRELDEALKASEGDTREYCQRERQAWEEALSTVQANVTRENEKFLATMEEKVDLRMERESQKREASVAQILSNLDWRLERVARGTSQLDSLSETGRSDFRSPVLDSLPMPSSQAETPASSVVVVDMEVPPAEVAAEMEVVAEMERVAAEMEVALAEGPADREGKAELQQPVGQAQQSSAPAAALAPVVSFGGLKEVPMTAMSVPPASCAAAAVAVPLPGLSAVASVRSGAVLSGVPPMQVNSVDPRAQVMMAYGQRARSGQAPPRVPVFVAASPGTAGITRQQSAERMRRR